MRVIQSLAGLTVVLGFFSAFKAEGQVNIWTNTISGKWEAPANWSLGLPPLNTQSLFITNVGADISISSSVVAKQVIVDGATSSFSPTMTVSNVTLAGAGTNIVNWLDLTNAGTNVPLHVLRQVTLATGSELTVTNSSLQVDNVLSVGAQPPPGFIANFPALVAVDSGLVQAGTIALGNAPNSFGVFDVFSGTVNVGNLNVGGSAGLGSLLECGGTINVLGNAAILSGSLSVTSSVTVLGGSFIATNGAIQVGPFGSGFFSISGGNHVFRQLLLGGSFPNSSGLFVMSGGTLQILGIGTGPGQGVVANSFDIGNADVDGSGTSITIGDNGHSASASLSGGFMKFAAMYAGYQSGYSGTYSQLAGTMLITSNLTVGGDCPDGASGAVGTVTVTGGAVYVTNAAHNAVLDIQNGTFTLGPGAVLAADNLVVTDACGQFINNGGIVLPGNSFYTANLLLNPGAEAGALSNWTTTGNVGVDDASEGGVEPNTGGFYFAGGSGAASLSQVVGLVGNQGITASAIDSGQLVAYASFWENQSNLPPPDASATVTIAFLDAGMKGLGTNSTPGLATFDGNWTNSTSSFPIPALTRFISYTVNIIPAADDFVFVDDNLLIVSGPPSPPVLAVSKTGTNVLLSWPAWASNGILQFTTNLSMASSWQDLTNVSAGTPAGFFFTDSIVGPDRFYRLRTP
jgi:hypothetical protein